MFADMSSQHVPLLWLEGSDGGMFYASAYRLRPYQMYMCVRIAVPAAQLVWDEHAQPKCSDSKACCMCTHAHVRFASALAAGGIWQHATIFSHSFGNALKPTCADSLPPLYGTLVLPLSHTHALTHSHSHSHTLSFTFSSCACRRAKC